MSEVLSWGAFEIAEKIKSGQISATDTVNTMIARIQEVNPKINAVVEERFSEARREARDADESKDKSKLLHGVPFTTKEMIAVEGFRSTLGSIHRKHNIQRRDATIIERLKNAGAILLGSTNVPEVGFWFECSNKVYGRTNNPYNFNRTPGGSSGGEAAILATGASSFGLGSDIGGSIRIPAFFCGIFGHKPSNGIIPFTGHSPMYHENVQNYQGAFAPLTTVGPLTKKAKDLYSLTELLMGDDNYDPVIKKNFQLKPRVADWKGKSIYILPSPRVHGTSETEMDLADSVINAGKYFSELGANTIEIKDDIFVSAIQLWKAGMSTVQGRSFNKNLNPLGPIDFAPEFFRLAVGKGNYTFPALMTAFLEKNNLNGVESEGWIKNLNRIREKLTKLLGSNGILIMPSHPRKAPKHFSPMFRPFDFCYTGVVNALKFPATAVPMGLADNGLPLGVQVIAAEDQDHLTMSAAETLESAFGGWVMAKI